MATIDPLKILKQVQDKLGELFTLWEDAPPLARYGIPGAGIVLLLMIFILMLPAKKDDAKTSSSPENQKEEIPISQDYEGLVIPEIPRLQKEGYPDLPFMPLPRWDFSDFSQYMPEFRDLLAKALHKKNEELLQEILESETE